MKKPLLLLAALTISAFGIIAVLKRSAADRSGDAADTATVERDRIKTFWTLYNDANAARIAGNFEKAIAAFRECLELDPRHEDSLYNLGTSLKEIGEYKEAAASYRRLIEVNPASNRAWSELGNVLSLRAPGAPLDFEEARRAFERSIEINREQAGPFLQLGKLELDQRNLDAARKQFQIASGFGSPEGNFFLGYTYFLENKNEQAAECFRKVLDHQARERAIAAQGVTSEGDILPAPGKPMTALERAGVKSLLFLRWISNPPEAPQALSPEVPQAFSPVSSPDPVTADFNGDGKPDRFVLRWLKNAVLYINGADVTAAAGLAGIRGPSYSAVAFDYDKDGWQDLLVTSHAPFEEVARCIVQPAYTPARCTPRLFRNTGGGKFEEVTSAAGLLRCYGTLRAVARDFDSDGWTDILLINGSLDNQRLEPNVLLRNLAGKGLAAEQRGLTPISRP